MNTLQILTLLASPRLTRQMVRRIYDKFPYNPANLAQLHEILEEAKRKGVLERVPNLDELKSAQSYAETILSRAEKLEVQVLGASHPAFPAQLQNIPDPPVLLYSKGAVSCLAEFLPASANDNPSRNPNVRIAVIGTREPTSFGAAASRRIGQRLAEQGIVVVSGLALGCDTAAHQGCLAVQGGRTVAILPNSLDVPVYLSQNQHLAQQIVEVGGCLVSEYAFGQRQRPEYFIERDRLQAGLSAGVILIESEISGGSMHTARFCAEQGKPLGCLVYEPGKLINNLQYAGNQELLDSGKAIPLRDRAAIEAFILGITEAKTTLATATVNGITAVTNQSNQISAIAEEIPKDNDATRQMSLF